MAGYALISLLSQTLIERPNFSFQSRSNFM